MTDLLNIAVSGLNSSRIGLSVTGQNITNVNTEGYTRQRAEFGTRTPEFLGGFFLGSGVEVDTVRRITNEFMVAAERSDISLFGKAETFSGMMDQLDQLFSNANTGLAGNMSGFFTSLQAVVDNPTSIETRQVFLSTADGMAQKFSNLQDQLLNMRSNMGQQVEVVATEVSSLAAEIAGLNIQISAARNVGQPNDLLDRRDQALRNLSKLIDTKVVDTGDGNLTVSIGKGQPLVVGAEYFTLTTQPDVNNAAVNELVVRTASGTVSRVGGGISGGLLGGLLDAQGSVIDGALNNLGRVALGISDAMNTAHNLGMDLENNLGGNLFTDINSAASVANRTVASANNAGLADQVVTVNVSDVTKLSVSDYQLTFTSPTTYVLTRISDGKSNAALDSGLSGSLAFSATPPAPSSGTATLTVDGLTIDLTRPSGDFSTGDRFLLQPTRGFGSDIALQVNRAEELALASPIRTESSLSNTGTASISSGVVTDKSTAFFSTTAQQLTPPLLIEFTSATAYNIVNKTTSAVLGSGTIPPNDLSLSSYGIQAEISGTPVAGDSFTIDYNSGGVLDNRAGLGMIKSQSTGLLGNGKLTLEGAYGVFTQQVGTRTSTARNDLEASKVLMEQSQGMLQSVAGVNLDEEAATLVEYEQAYNAAAQVVSIARTLFDTLISAVR